MSLKSGLKYRIDINQMEKLQNDAVRIINFGYFRDSVNPLYYESKVLKLQESVKIQIVICFKEVSIGTSPLF